MIPQALFVPASLPAQYGGCYEVNHLGVVLRVRDGKWEHIGAVCLRHEQNLVNGKWDLTYTVTREQLPAVGKVVEGHHGVQPGWWLVPEKHVDDFAEAVALAELAEQVRASASEQAAAKTTVAPIEISGDAFVNDSPRHVARRTRAQLKDKE